MLYENFVSTEGSEKKKGEMSKSWLRNGYNKVARILGRDPKKQNFPGLQGHPAAQVAVETQGDIQNRVKKLYKEFRIYRWIPDHPTNNKPFLQSYYVDLSNCGPMVLVIFLFAFPTFH